MKIKDILTLFNKTIIPEENIHYHLYSLPSFDINQREEVKGQEILSNKFIVPDKCILFNKLNVRFKRVWRINNNDDNKICSTEFLPLVVNESKVDYQYCYYLLVSDFITNYLSEQNANTSGSHKRIDPTDFFNINVSLPPIEEQRKIGSLLASIDYKISINKAINHNLEAMIMQLYDYWFVQFDFPNENGRPYKSSGGKMIWNKKLKCSIPEGWISKPLSAVCQIINGATPSTTDERNYGGDIVWITPKDLSDQQSKFIDHGQRYITEKGFKSCSTSFVSIGTLLLSSRAPIGLLSIAKTKLCTNQGFKSLCPSDSNDTNYLYYYIKRHISQIEQLGTGTTFKEVSKDDLNSFPILCVTNNNVYSQWCKISNIIFSQQYEINKEVEILTKQRDELLPLLMNGQVEVVNYDL